MDTQYSLFAEQALPLVHDAEGGMVYHPDCVAPEQAQAWFAALLHAVPWRHWRRPMYDRVVNVPRLIANFRLHDAARPPCLDAALRAVQRLAPAPYTRVGLNLYRDGRDSVAPHGDREDDLCPGQPIAILSLGAPRTMRIAPAAGGGGQSLLLAPGSLLVMSHASQRTHTHAIPKCKRAGLRISLAFRVRRHGDDAGGNADSALVR